MCVCVCVCTIIYTYTRIPIFLRKMTVFNVYNNVFLPIRSCVLKLIGVCIRYYVCVCVRVYMFACVYKCMYTPMQSGSVLRWFKSL